VRYNRTVLKEDEDDCFRLKGDVMSHVFLRQQLGDIFLELVRPDHNPNVDPWAKFRIGSPKGGVKTDLAPLQAQRLSDILDHWVTLEGLPSDTPSSWPQRGDRLFKHRLLSSIVCGAD